MTFFQEPYQDSIGKNEPISTRDKSYQSQRFRQQVFGRIAKAFAERASQHGLTKARVAALLGKDKAQLNRTLAFPTNLTIDTISEIALALNFEPRIVFDRLEDDPRHNYSHFCYNLSDNENVHNFQIKTLSTGFVSMANPTKTTMQLELM
jgi:transcriptional regulator with XRE-family HTH domain